MIHDGASPPPHRNRLQRCGLQEVSGRGGLVHLCLSVDTNELDDLAVSSSGPIGPFDIGKRPPPGTARPGQRPLAGRNSVFVQRLSLRKVVVRSCRDVSVNETSFAFCIFADFPRLTDKMSCSLLLIRIRRIMFIGILPLTSPASATRASLGCVLAIGSVAYFREEVIMIGFRRHVATSLTFIRHFSLLPSLLDRRNLTESALPTSLLTWRNL